MPSESKLELSFWRYWLGGLLLLALMIAMNTWLSNDVSPWGISDHQAASTAVRVDAIQEAWQSTSVLGLARIGIALDLIYIAAYSFGAYCGGRLFAQSPKPALRRLGWVIVAGAIIVGIADYIETICQFIQIMTLKGSDRLAGIAATAKPIKSTAFLTTFIGLLTALFLRKRGKRAA